MSPSAHSDYSGAAPAPARSRVTAETASSSHVRHDDGLTAACDQDMSRATMTPDADAVRTRKEMARRAASWDEVGVEFDELSDYDSDGAVPPTPTKNTSNDAASGGRSDVPPKLTPTASASGLTCGTAAAPAAGTAEAGSDCEMEMDGQSEAGNQSQEVDDVGDLDLDDSLSTHNIHAWRALVTDDMRSFDGDMELGDYDMWNPESDAASSAAPFRFIADAQPCGSPTATAATLFPSGITAPAMRARSVTPVRCPRAAPSGTPRRRNCVTGVRGGRVVVSVGRASPACQGGGGCACSNSGRIVGPLPSASYAADVRRAAGCSARAMQVDRALTPPRLMGRVTSNDSLYGWTAAPEGAAPMPRPPLPPLALDSVHRQAMRRYGRRAASAGVSRAVAAVAAGDASPVEVHVSG